MGTSGSGKTSLLNLLSGRITAQPHLEIFGEINLNHIPIDTFNSNHYIKYVTQEDYLFSTQTVRESLTFAARLKVPNITYAEIMNRVDLIINALKLEKVSDNIIGSLSTKGLSGGEKKRLSIGNELISNPSVLILDEPTSGLDSSTAELVVDLLKEQAKIGKTIVFTIHQPGFKIFNVFDRLILMSEGEFVYQGKAKNSVLYFSNIGFVCSLLINPPDFFMKILFIKVRNFLTINEENHLQILISNYKHFELSNNKPKKKNLTEIDFHLKKRNTTMALQFRVIILRAFNNVKRQPMLSVMKIVQALFLSILIILIYHNNGNDSKSIQNIAGVLFFCVINLVSTAIQSQILTFPIERPVFLKEYSEDLYGVVPYFLSKMMCEIPFLVIFSVTYSCIVYFVVPFNAYDASKFFIFFAICLIGQLAGYLVGNFVGSMSANFSFAITLAPTLMISLVAFGGFFSSSNSLTKAFYWIKYISPFYYGYQALILNQFNDFQFPKGTNNPIDTLSFNGKIWEPISCLLLICLALLIFILLILKLVGELYKKK